MNSLCDKNEAQAFHPPEQKPSDGAALWAAIVVAAMSSAVAYVFLLGAEWY